MKLSNLNQFLVDYFSAHECPVIQNDDGVLKVQLTEEMDKTLMNRPFYWHYVKSTGMKGEPKKVTFITNPNRKEEQGEWIHFGAPRLQQIFQQLKNNARYIQLFQQIQTIKNTPLYPWLVINIKISYKGTLTKEELFSFGLQLINGQMKTNMMENLKEISLGRTISDYCYTISPLITISSGFKRIETIIDQYITDQQHIWAEKSMERLHEEIQMVKQFFREEDDHALLDKEIDALKRRYEPRITTKVINGGVVYLKGT